LQALAEGIVKESEVLADTPFFNLISSKEHYKRSISGIILWDPELAIDKLLYGGICRHSLVWSQISQEHARWAALWLIKAPTVWMAENLPHLSWSELRAVHARAVGVPALVLKLLDAPFDGGRLSAEEKAASAGLGPKHLGRGHFL
jgi:hypothetical protein